MGNDPKFDQEAFAIQAGGELLKLLIAFAFMAMEKQGLDTEEKKLAWIREQSVAFHSKRGELAEAINTLTNYVDMSVGG
jgi:hypothetical protein